MRWSWVQAKRWNYPQPNMSRNFVRSKRGIINLFFVLVRNSTIPVLSIWKKKEFFFLRKTLIMRLFQWILQSTFSFSVACKASCSQIQYGVLIGTCHEALNRFCFFLSVKRRYFKGKFPSISILFKYNITRYLKLRGNVLDKLTIFYLINVAVAMPCMGLSEICLEFMSCSTGYVQNV